MKARLPSLRRKQDKAEQPASPESDAAPGADVPPDDQPTQRFSASDIAQAAVPPAGEQAPSEAPTTVQDAAEAPGQSTETWVPAIGAGGTTPPPVPPVAPAPADLDPAAMQVASAPSFRDRGRLRRRLAYLRRVRELGFRDLGGLVYDLHRFRHPGEELVRAKLNALDVVDRELRALERVLRDKPLYVDLREPGIAACPRCAALHGSDARYCPSCGMRLEGPQSIGQVGADAPGAGGAPMWPTGSPPAPGSAAAMAAEQPTQALPATPPPNSGVASAVAAAASAPPTQETQVASQPEAAPTAQEHALKDQGDKLGADEHPAPAAGEPVAEPAPDDSPVPADEPAKEHGDPLEAEAEAVAAQDEPAGDEGEDAAGDAEDDARDEQ
jgi:hypothetical protein